MTACGNTVKSVPVVPPARYYAEDCVETAVDLSTNKTLVFKIEQLRRDLMTCNADREGIRAWAKEVK